jgi:hypothetical protein
MVLIFEDEEGTQALAFKDDIDAAKFVIDNAITDYCVRDWNPKLFRSFHAFVQTVSKTYEKEAIWY